MPDPAVRFAVVYAKYWPFATGFRVGRLAVANMGTSDAQRLAEHAAAVIRGGRPLDALKFVESALEAGSGYAPAHRLKGIIEAKAGKSDAARKSFQAALTLEPRDPCTLYNYALLLARTGDTKKAKEVVDACLSISPAYALASELAAEIAAGNLTSDYDPGLTHSIQWIEQAGKRWTVIGWVIVGSATAALASNLIWKPFTVSAGTPPVPHLATGTLPMILVFLTIVAQLSVFAWMVSDLLDRRGRVIWLIPLMVFSIFGGLGALPMALYLLIGRK